MSQLKLWNLQLSPGWMEDDDQKIINEAVAKFEPSEDIDNPDDLTVDLNLFTPVYNIIICRIQLHSHDFCFRVFNNHFCLEY